MGLNMEKLMVYAGVFLMIISCCSDGIVIYDAWDDLTELNEKKDDWVE